MLSYAEYKLLTDNIVKVTSCIKVKRSICMTSSVVQGSYILVLRYLWMGTQNGSLLELAKILQCA